MLLVVALEALLHLGRGALFETPVVSSGGGQGSGGGLASSGPPDAGEAWGSC